MADWRCGLILRTDTGEMNRDRAETYLRLLAEAELRRARAPLANRAQRHLHAAARALARDAP